MVIPTACHEEQFPKLHHLKVQSKTHEFFVLYPLLTAHRFTFTFQTSYTGRLNIFC